jgi:hypothetical protein
MACSREEAKKKEVCSKETLAKKGSLFYLEESQVE